MKLRTLLPCILCFSLAVSACGGRLRNNQPTQPAFAVATEAQAIQPTTALEQPTTQPTEPAPTAELHTATSQPPLPTEAPTVTPPPTVAPPPAPAVTAESQSDPQGDEVETLLQQLDDANGAANKELQELSTP